MLNKLFFFRHIINGSVVLSKTPSLYNHHLTQVGLHRPGIVLRRDHWIPFLLFESESCDLSPIYKKLLIKYKYPLPKVRYPLPIKSMVWTIPDKVQKTIINLHSLVTKEPINGKMSWERLEYQKLENLEWPGTISHDKLLLFKNSIPDFKSKTVLKPYKQKTKLEY